MNKKRLSEEVSERLTDAKRTAKGMLHSATSHAADCVRNLTSAAIGVGKNVASGTGTAVRRIDANHEAIAEHVDTAAKVTRVAAGVAALGAAVAAPTGLTAVGVAVGIVSAPAIVTAAPVLLSVAAGAASISAAATLYKKARRRRPGSSEG